MKKPLALIVGLPLLAGSGFFGYEYFAKGIPPRAVIQGETDKTPRKGEKKAVKTEKLDLRYVNIPPLTIAIAREGRVERIYSASIVLEVDGAKDEEVVKDDIPFLQSRFFQTLYGLSALPRHIDVINAPIVKRHLQKVADETVGKGVVREVLIQAAFDRRV
jgi:hypothetical protein